MSVVLNSSMLRWLERVPPSCFVFAVPPLILWFARHQMLNSNVLGIFVRQVAPLGILVLGQLLVMRVKSIDLSSGGYRLGDRLFNGMMIGVRRGLARRKYKSRARD